MANEHFLKSMAFRFVDLEHDIGEQRVGSEVVHILLGLLHRTGQCSVDALGGDQDASLEAQLFAVLQMLGREGGRILDPDKLIK
ncbi:hypothetical protein D3C74_425020 [compost metagenome]